MGKMMRFPLLIVFAIAALPWLGSCGSATAAESSPPKAAAQTPAAAQVPPASGHRATIISLKKSLIDGVPSPPPADAARLGAARPLVQALDLRAKAIAALERFVPKMTETIKFRNPKLSDAEMKKAPDRIRANAYATLDRLLDYEAHVYARHFTVDQLKALTAFYRSDAGKRLLLEEANINLEMGPAKSGWTYGYLVATNKQMGGKSLQPGMRVNVKPNASPPDKAVKHP